MAIVDSVLSQRTVINCYSCGVFLGGLTLVDSKVINNFISVHSIIIYLLVIPGKKYTCAQRSDHLNSRGWEWYYMIGNDNYNE